MRALINKDDVSYLICCDYIPSCYSLWELMVFPLTTQFPSDYDADRINLWEYGCSEIYMERYPNEEEATQGFNSFVESFPSRQIARHKWEDEYYEV